MLIIVVTCSDWKGSYFIHKKGESAIVSELIKEKGDKRFERIFTTKWN